MPPPPELPPETMLTDRAGVQQVLGRCGVDIRLDADRTGVVSAQEEAILTDSLRFGTEFVHALLGGRFALAQLAKSWLIYRWASIIAAQNLCLYRCGNVPASLQAEFERAENYLQLIMSGQMPLASIASKSGTGVSMDNMRMDGRFGAKQLRVETTISDGSRVQRSPQIMDIPTRYIPERNQ